MTEEEQIEADAATAARRGVLARLLEGLAEGEGYSPSRLPGVKFMRSTRSIARTPVAYDPSIVIIAQGRKLGYLGGRSFIYDADHYLVLSVPLPFECETLASPGGPLLGISVGVTPAMVAELMMEMEKPAPIPAGRPEAIRAHRLDGHLYDAAVRLARTLSSADEARILGPQIVREIAYRVLCGEAGGPLRAMAAPHSHFGQISRALRRLHADYAKPMDMETLASEAGMSVSTFHAHFKAVTSSPPLQYLKTIRLHKARMLMLHEGQTAGSAALSVGYESASQFSREFKRFFGNTPAAETEKLKASLMRLA